MPEIDVERKVRDLLTELRAGADALFAVKEARYEEPAVIYPATV
jgi:hypothetical protein